MMVTNEKVLDIFVDYLEKDQALDVVSTRRGYAVMLWDFKGQDWSDVKCCTTPEALFDKLLDSFVAYEEYLLLQDKKSLNDNDRKRIDTMCQIYQERWKEAETQ